MARGCGAWARRALSGWLLVVGVGLVSACGPSPAPPTVAEPATETAADSATGTAAAPDARTAPSTDPSSQDVTAESLQAPGAEPGATSQASGSARRVSVVVGGDVLVHPPLWRTATADAARAGRRGYDFAPLLAGLRPLVSGADLAICHLETPVAAPGAAPSGYPSFAVPPAILPALAATGYDGCTTASNHSIDAGVAGLARTLAALDAAGLKHTGTWGSARGAGAPMVLTAHGVRVAVINETYGLNGRALPADRRWAVRIIDPARIVASAKAARAAGADIVLVALHWGQEYQSAPTAAQTRIAAALARSGQIDLLYGHHAHVVQPVERVGGMWVLYGLGNAVAHHATRAPGVDDGVSARIVFTPAATPTPAPAGARRWRVEQLTYVPTTVLRAAGARPARIVAIADAVADRALPAAERRRLAQAQQRVGAVVRSRGAVATGRGGDLRVG